MPRYVSHRRGKELEGLRHRKIFGGGKSEGGEHEGEGRDRCEAQVYAVKVGLR